MIQTAQPQPYFHQHQWWCGIIQFVGFGHKIKNSKFDQNQLRIE